MAGRNARRREEAAAREAARTAAEQAARAQRRRVAALTIGLLVAVLAAGATYLVVTERRADALEARLTAGSCVRDQQADRTEGSGHVPSPSYAVDPPAGGDHLADAARAGAFTAARAPADGLLVHSLEHGYVVLWYGPGATASDVDALLTVQRDNPDDVILVERPSLPVRVAATAWEQRLLCPGVEPDALSAFVERFVGKGPEKVDRG